MPAERIDKRRNKAADPCETIDLEVRPIASEQSRAARNADDEKTNQKAAMQINPKKHDHRQRQTSRSLQTFSIENHAKQHGKRVWRSGEIDIGCRRERGIQQTRRENGNTNRGCRGPS